MGWQICLRQRPLRHPETRVNQKLTTSFYPPVCAQPDLDFVWLGAETGDANAVHSWCRATAPFSRWHLELLAWWVKPVLLHHSMGTCAKDVGATRGHGYIRTQRFLLLLWIISVPRQRLNLTLTGQVTGFAPGEGEEERIGRGCRRGSGFLLSAEVF